MFKNPDLTALLIDPAIGGSTPFTILRTTYTPDSGTVTEHETSVNATGLIQPQPPTVIQSADGENPCTETIRIWTATPLSLGSAADSSKPDNILYNDRRYRITQLHDWSAWGWYEAIAVRIIG